MKKVITRASLLTFMGSIIFRIILIPLGVALFLFYGMLMPAAIVNLPLSLFGFLYCLTGMISGILCFTYFFKKKKVWLVIIIPFAIFMVITLVNEWKWENNPDRGGLRKGNVDLPANMEKWTEKWDGSIK
ncbi:MAG: hypothetical protein HY806_01795 [Nitrospirae bacterium]|nr:hypothetical protein [Nitrospirota bacterium]